MYEVQYRITNPAVPETNEISGFATIGAFHEASNFATDSMIQQSFRHSDYTGQFKK